VTSGSDLKSKQPLVVIVGPTAVGKTEFSIRLALKTNGEIVTADSMQVYRGLDIASAKPTIKERRGVAHHLIDIVDPDEAFNVAEYRTLAHQAIASVHSRGRLPILSGGTGLYVKAVLDEFLFPDEGADPILRRELEQEAELLGPDALHDRLRAVDPAAAARIHPNDVRRVVRALEVHARTGVPFSEHLKSKTAPAPPYETLMFGLTRPREELYRRIDERVDEQIRMGLVGEIKEVLAKYGEPKIARQALGFKEIASYLKGERTLEEAVEILKRDTRRFAKRQYTWFRREDRIKWIDLDEIGSIERAVDLVEVDIRAAFYV